MAKSEKFYDNLIYYLMENIAEGVKINDIQNNDELAKMLANIDSLIQQMGESLSEAVTQDLQDVFFESLEEARGYLEKEGLELSGKGVFSGGQVSAQFKTKANLNAIQFIVIDTMLDLEASFRTARNEGISNILDTVANIRSDIAEGLLLGSNREVVVGRVKETIRNGGLTGFTTVDGKRLPIDFYARTVVRTKTQTARNKAHIKTYHDADVNLIQVTGANPTCGRCSAYRGVTFDTTGQDKRYPYLDFDTVFPLHPNCKCVALPYVEEYKSEDELVRDYTRSSRFNPDSDRRNQSQKEAYDERMKKQRTAREEEREYKRMQYLLGNKAPKSIGAYRNIKRNNPTKYKELKQKLRDQKET